MQFCFQNAFSFCVFLTLTNPVVLAKFFIGFPSPTLPKFLQAPKINFYLFAKFRKAAILQIKLTFRNCAVKIEKRVAPYYQVGFWDRNSFCFVPGKKHHSQTFKSVSFVNNSCPQCGKQFGRKDAVQRHYMEMHMRSVQFPCSKCAKVFKRKYAMESHAKKCPGDTIPRCFRSSQRFCTSAAQHAHL